jgi:hypothetical protein
MDYEHALSFPLLQLRHGSSRPERPVNGTDNVLIDSPLFELFRLNGL